MAENKYWTPKQNNNDDVLAEDFNKAFKTIEEDMNGKADKEAGKGLSSNDFTDAFKTKLEGLSNYDDSNIWNTISDLKTYKADKTEIDARALKENAIIPTGQNYSNNDFTDIGTNFLNTLSIPVFNHNGEIATSNSNTTGIYRVSVSSMYPGGDAFIVQQRLGSVTGNYIVCQMFVNGNIYYRTCVAESGGIISNLNTWRELGDNKADKTNVNWQLIDSAELTADVQSVSKTLGGNYRDLYIVFRVPTMNADKASGFQKARSYVYIQNDVKIYDDGDYMYEDRGNTWVLSFRISMIGNFLNLTRMFNHTARNIDDVAYASYPSNAGGTIGYLNDKKMTENYISSVTVRLYPNNTRYFPTGTTYEIWGIKA